MLNTTLYHDTSTKVSWRFHMPAIIGTVGMLNHVVIDLQETPEAAKAREIEASFFSVDVHDSICPSNGIFSIPIAPVPEHSTTLDMEFMLPDTLSRGYYIWHLVLYNADKQPIDMYDCPFVLDRSITPLNDDHLPLEDVRLELSDIIAEDNKLLDSLEFSDGDIAHAVIRTIKSFNDTPPLINRYTGSSFPYPDLLKTGCVYLLLQSLCVLLERNRLGYQSEGGSVDIERRVDFYKQLCAKYEMDWRKRIDVMKQEEDYSSFTGGSYYY